MKSNNALNCCNCNIAISISLWYPLCLQRIPQRLDDLYHEFFIPLELAELKSYIEDNHKILIDHLSKEDRKIILRIIDALEMICNYQTKASFIQGFKLGFELTTELQIHDAHSAEISSHDCGYFFMPMEVHKDEKGN